MKTCRNIRGRLVGPIGGGCMSCLCGVGIGVFFIYRAFHSLFRTDPRFGSFAVLVPGIQYSAFMFSYYGKPDRSIPRSLQRWVSTKCSISQLTFFILFYYLYIPMGRRIGADLHHDCTEHVVYLCFYEQKKTHLLEGGWGQAATTWRCNCMSFAV